MNCEINSVLAWEKSGKEDWEKQKVFLHGLTLSSEKNMDLFFKASVAIFLHTAYLESLLEQGFMNLPLEILAQEQQNFFSEIKPTKSGQKSGYDFCYANPDFACSQFGRKMGQLLSNVYVHFRSSHKFIFLKNYTELVKMTELFHSLYELWQTGNTDYENWKAAYLAIVCRDLEKNTLLGIYETQSPAYDFYRAIIMTSDYSDIRYLYQYGSYLAERDLNMATFISDYPENELKSLSQYIVQSYLNGFLRSGKDYRIKKYVNIMVPLGMERLANFIANDFISIKLEPIFKQPASIGANQQYHYDTRFSNALYFDDVFSDRLYNALVASYEIFNEIIRANSGTVYVDVFGEEPFEPRLKETALKLSDEQRKIQMQMQGKISQYYISKFPRTENSFCIIAFPSPEIGADFEAIFAETLAINLLDSKHYAVIQQHLVEVLDEAEYVHILGVHGNDTDIKVMMHKLGNPEKETNFENCVADVNIPVGEVFTSPVLKGTNGILHVEQIYLNNLSFLNLKIWFENGYVKNYSCTNFKDEAQNQLFIEENLLHPHKTLPIGEFAIGTNTKAYRMAKKYDIMHLLPILIIEKMGPHFAIGDTCFSHEEEFPHHNIESNKRIIAVENEKSAIRHTNPMEAYTQKHTDITLPYEMLSEIIAVKADGTKISIIKNGLFAVPGTEELNIPLMEILQNC